MIKKDNSNYELKDTDMYRHIVNEVGLTLAEFKDNKISVPLIVKNEAWFIGKTLESIKDFVDEIVIVDTGSTDNTIEIAKKYTDKIYHYTWDDSFANARNFALSKCTGDWILRVDGDEIFPEEAKLPLWSLIQNNTADIIAYDIKNFMEDPEKKSNATYVISRTARAYKNIPGIKYKGRVHEEIDESLDEINKTRDVKNKLKMTVSGNHLYHYGYLRSKQELDNKHDYYAKLCGMELDEDPDNYKPYFNLATHYYHTKDFIRAKIFYTRTLDLNPKQWLAWHEYGVVLYHEAMGKIKDELNTVKKCFEHCKENLPKDVNKDYINQIESNHSSINRLIKATGEESSSDQK
jgi:glycosyltransferase involved in cell wall biosynthesis